MSDKTEECMRNALDAIADLFIDKYPTMIEVIREGIVPTLVGYELSKIIRTLDAFIGTSVMASELGIMKRGRGE